MKPRTKRIIIISAFLVLVGVYFYMRKQAKNKGYHENKFFASIFGVEHRPKGTTTPTLITQTEQATLSEQYAEAQANCVIEYPMDLTAQNICIAQAVSGYSG